MDFKNRWIIYIIKSRQLPRNELQGIFDRVGSRVGVSVAEVGVDASCSATCNRCSGSSVYNCYLNFWLWGRLLKIVSKRLVFHSHQKAVTA